MKYLRLDELPYAAVVSEEDFANHYVEVCEEFATSRKEYLYVHHLRSATFLHFTTQDKIESIMLNGLVPGSEYCDVGSAVYAFRSITPLADIFPLQKSWEEMRTSPIAIVEFIAPEYYQCVHAVDSGAPVRYCVMTHPVSPSTIVRVHDNLISAHRKCSSKDFVHSMGYPYDVVQAIPAEFFEENSAHRALHYLNDTPLTEIMRGAPEATYQTVLTQKERDVIMSSLHYYDSRKNRHIDGWQPIIDQLMLKLSTLQVT